MVTIPRRSVLPVGVSSGVVLVFLLGPASSNSSELPPVKIEVLQANQAHISGDRIRATDARTDDVAQAALEGDEKSECVVYGRRSQANATAKTEILKAEPDHVALRFSSSVSVRGGHYRSCFGCVLNTCLGTEGHDTRAQAQASAGANVAIRFADDYPPIDYLLNISNPDPQSPLAVELRDSSGKSVPLERSPGKGQILHGKPGASYFLTFALPLTGSDNGGCCSDTKTGQSTVDTSLSVIKAPILAAAMDMEPYIAGGRQTTSYKNVGAVLLGSDLQCTGTVLGAHTILTAAHCISGFESRMTTIGLYVTGSNIVQPDAPPIKVTGYAFPHGEMLGYNYIEKTYSDDIGLLYTADAITSTPVVIHSGTPKWNDIWKLEYNLTFVGFGYDVVEQQPVAPGIKREASWHITEAPGSRTVRYSVPGKNTCKGDSGGPAFLVMNGKIVQVGITSVGDSACTVGVDTRVDAFGPWLSGKIK
jgi:secreted trypsin-like serine protease